MIMIVGDYFIEFSFAALIKPMLTGMLDFT